MQKDNYEVEIHKIYLQDNEGENRYSKEELFGITTNEMPMDKFQMRAFVVQQAHTPYKQILQCQMEIDSRKAGLKEYEFSMRELEADLEIYRERVEQAPEGPQKKKYQVKLERVEWQYDRKKHQRERFEIEIGYLLEFYQELTNKLSFDEMKENREQLELEYWKARMSKQAGVDLLSHGVVGVGNMLSIMDMPKEVMEETLALTVERAEKMKKELPNGVGEKLFTLGHDDVKRNLELEFTKAEVQNLLTQGDFLDTEILNSSSTEEKEPVASKIEKE
jgi:hypothetical protein